MNRYQHVLIVGGTGMLRAASVELAASCLRLTSIARTKASLRELDRALRPGSALHHPLQLDWSDPDRFIEGIVEHIESTEAPDLVVAWIHDGRLAIRLAARIIGFGARPRFFHVIGSASADPARVADSLQDDVAPRMSAHYHQVILGAKGAATQARWLTDQEISEGVLDAIERREARFVVGDTERPRAARDGRSGGTYGSDE